MSRPPLATNGTDMRIALAVVAGLLGTGALACSSSVARAPNVELACELERCPLRFEGNAQVSDAELASEIARREPRRRELFRELVPVLVRAAYYDRGFVDARVTSRTAAASDGGHVLVVAVDEGNPYWVDRLTVDDPASLPGEPLGNEGALRAAISQSEGAVFARHALIDDVQAILARYRETGYAWADADVAVNENRRERNVAVDITIVRGPATVVDRVDVHGGEGLSERALQERIALHPGDAYRRVGNRGFIARARRADRRGSSRRRESGSGRRASGSRRGDLRDHLGRSQREGVDADPVSRARPSWQRVGS
jgi:hypothetical protein